VIEMNAPSLEGDMGTVLQWADEVTDSCSVMANADSGPDAAKAADLGVQGIGLCRIEHMFFSLECLPVVHHWMLRGEELEKVQEFQRSDFREILDAMDGKPVTIRLLDPPVNEFMPCLDQVDEAMAMELGLGTDVKGLKDKIESLDKENPTLGLHSCRLGIVHPGLTAMQVSAILHAVADFVEKNSEAKPFPCIMIPLV
jgi:pyruvate,orthophosphate dikinase